MPFRKWLHCLKIACPFTSSGGGIVLNYRIDGNSKYAIDTDRMDKSTPLLARCPSLYPSRRNSMRIEKYQLAAQSGLKPGLSE